MEHTIGDIFDFEGNKLEVIENNSCKGCFFSGKGSCAFRKNVVGFCDSTNRDDGKSIIFKDITNMKDGVNEIRIVVPEGMEIDKENSTFERIKFKKKKVRLSWRENVYNRISGYRLDGNAIRPMNNVVRLTGCWDIFATEKQAKSAQAMAQISQIMANDKRFGGVVSEREWEFEDTKKFVIVKCCNRIRKDIVWSTHTFLAFHTKEQCDLFLKENEDLVKDFLMIE